MSTELTTENVQEVIADGLVEIGAEREEISPDATFETLDVDSLDLVEMAQIIDDEFNVTLTGNDVKDITTVGQLVDLVIDRAQTAAGATAS
jgi:acyl carrier protein